MEEYQGKATKVLADLKEQKVSIEDAVTMKAMNGLGTAFATYITILNENARNDKNMPKIDDFFKKLEDEERRMKQGTSTTNTAHQVRGRGGCGGRGGGRGGHGGSQTSGSSTPRCTLCGVNHSSDDECSHKDWDCHACNKKGHWSKNCDYVTKAAKEKAARKGKGKVKESKSNDDSDNDKKNITMATRWISLTNKEPPRMFNNIVLNVSTIKPTVNHVNKGISMLTDLLIDSGATAHMIANWGMFTQFSTEISYYQTGSSEILESSGRGTICIDFNIDGKSLRLHLTDCVCAPDLYYNLISTP